MPRRTHLQTMLACLLLLTPPLATAQEIAAVDPPPAVASAAGHASSPVAVVESLHETILEAMRKADELDFQGRYELLEPIVSQSFDLNFMGTKCVGRHWKKLSEAEKKSWLEKFTRLTTSNYAGRFNQYAGEDFETIGEEPAARSTQLVRTKLLIPSEEDVQLNYRLRETASGWRIIDVYLKGTVSELALRRSDFASTLKQGGFAKLAAAIDQKIEDLRSNGGG